MIAGQLQDEVDFEKIAQAELQVDQVYIEQKTLNEIGQQCGVHPVVGQWKKELMERAAMVFDCTRGLKPAVYAEEACLLQGDRAVGDGAGLAQKSPDYEQQHTNELD